MRAFRDSVLPFPGGPIADRQQNAQKGEQTNKITEEEDPSFPGDPQRLVYFLAGEEGGRVPLKTLHEGFLEDEIVPVGRLDSFGQLLILVPLSAIEHPNDVVVRTVHPFVNFFDEFLPRSICTHQIRPCGFIVHEVPES